jgi:hypothetical protein
MRRGRRPSVFALDCLPLIYPIGKKVMSIKVQVEFQYCQHGKKTIQKGSDLITVPENTTSAIRAVLRLLHPHWEAIKVLSSSEQTQEAA